MQPERKRRQTREKLAARMWPITLPNYRCSYMKLIPTFNSRTRYISTTTQSQTSLTHSRSNALAHTHARKATAGYLTSLSYYMIPNSRFSTHISQITPCNSHLVTHIPLLMPRFPCLISRVSYLMSHISYLISHISLRACTHTCHA